MSDLPLPSEQQKARAKWDLLLADIELRQEQLRVARPEIHWKPRQVAFACMTTGAALFGAGAAFVKVLGG